MLQPPLYRSRFFWGVNDPDGFDKGLDGLVSAARVKQGWFMSDNMIAFGRNLGFLDDAPFRKAWETHAKTQSERGIVWRSHVVVWAARRALRLEGDFIECGCYKGTTARIMADVVDLTDRQLYLYDLFEHDASMVHHAMPEHGPDLFEFVKARFPEPNTHVIRGFVPESFEQGVPDRIAFAHIDMNNAPAEIAALNAIEDRLVPGAMIVLDDFGAIPYRRQHVAETAWFGERGRFVLELPTSQGLVIW
ncbi:class I SAM-dependent methyltransferase [Phenylobacterium sp.]|uniref:class I SAM-dependent methyltransferase n=1 Tax=Phenylobacterium sp. TaxID=1871053 RepID=UPI002EDB9021